MWFVGSMECRSQFQDLKRWELVWFYCYAGATSGGMHCFLNVFVALRNFISASMPSGVPRMSDVMMSSEASLRVWRWFS